MTRVFAILDASTYKVNTLLGCPACQSGEKVEIVRLGRH